MLITRTHHLDASLDACWAMFHDPESHVAKFTAMGHRDVQIVERDVQDDRLRLVIDRVVDVEVPSFARKVLKPTNQVRSVDEWIRKDDRSCAGTFTLSTRGVPLEIGGSTSLQVDGDSGCRYEIQVEVVVRVPLIGGRIADIARGVVDQQLTDEFRLADAWLSEH